MTVVSQLTDPVAIAQAIIADPRKKYTMSTLQIMAVCKALVEVTDNPPPAITDDLAVAARALIAICDSFDERAHAQGIALAQAVSAAAFKTFKTAFEQEFPNGES